MNIAFVIPSMLRGGAERVMSILCNDLSSRGHNVILCLTENANDIMYPLVSRVSVVDMTYDKGCFAFKIPRYIGCLYRTFKEKKIDVVVSFITRTNIFSIIACKIAGIPVIVSERNNPSLVPANKKLRTVRDFLYNYSDGIVFQTKYARDYYSYNVQRKSIIIKNPCESPDTIMQYEKKENVIISACRLAPQKNVSLLIKAFSKIKDEIPDFNLHIYGDGPLKQDLERQIIEEGISDRAYIKGIEPDIIKIMAKSKIFALPSDYEGLSNSLTEAMCTGAACIATDSPTYGNRDIIKDKVSGVLVPVGNVDVFADNLKLIASNISFAKSLSNEAIKIRNQVCTDRIVTSWLSYIAEIIK